MMQWLAMLTMLIDHIGIVWFEDEIIYRIIGRMAFPIYAFYVVQGMQYTSNRRRYLMRLGILAVLSQAPFSLLFDTWTVNVIGTFFICVAGLYGFTEPRLLPQFRWSILIGSAALLLIVPCDYGIYALLLMLIYRYARGIQMMLYHVLLNMGFIVSMMTATIQIWSLLPSVVFSLTDGRFIGWVRRSRAPKQLWRIFYPGHLLLLWVLSMWVI